MFRLDFTSDNTIYTVFVSSLTYFLLAFGANQLLIHRCLCCRSDNDAHKALWVAVPMICLVQIMVVVIGLYIGRFYEHCDPSSFGVITEGDQIFPLFVMDIMSDVYGLPGIVMAGLASATLSTMSSGLNSIAAVVLEDYFRVFLLDRISEKRTRVLIQIITVFFGLVCIELAYLAHHVSGGLFQIDQVITGAVGSPLLGVFLLGLLFPWANGEGALIGMIGATILNVSLFYMKQGVNLDEDSLMNVCINNCNETIFTQELFQKYLSDKRETTIVYKTETNFLLQLSSRFYGALGVLATIIIGLIVSAMTGFQDLNTLEPALISPLFDVLFPLYYLPENVKKWFRFDLDHTDKWDRYFRKLEKENKALKAEKKKKAALETKVPGLFGNASLVRVPSGTITISSFTSRETPV